MTQYYIDSVSGADTNTGLTPSAAWRSLGKVNGATLAPGDEVLFKRGGTWTGEVEVSASGTAQAPITFGAYGSGANPVIGGGLHGFDVSQRSHLVFRDLTVNGTSSSAFEFQRAGNVILSHVTVDGSGDGQVGGAVNWVNGNELSIDALQASHLRGDGIWVWNADGVRITNSTLETVQGPSADNVHMVYVRNYEVSGNTLSMQGPTDSTKGNIHTFGGSNGHVVGNTFLGGTYGVGLNDNHVVVENNTFLGHDRTVWASAILVSENLDLVDNVYRNNRIDGTSNGIQLFSLDGLPYQRSGFVFEGNVITNATRNGFASESPISGQFTHNTIWAPDAAHLVLFDGTIIPGQTWTMEHNQYGFEQGSFSIKGTEYSSLAAWQAMTPWENASTSLTSPPIAMAAVAVSMASEGW